MTPKISPEQFREVLALAVKGETTDAIAAWLKTKYGVSISSRALRTRLAATRQERGDVAKTVVREVLTKSVTSDLDTLETQRATLSRLCTKLVDAGSPEDIELYLKTVDRLAKVVDLKLHYSGADSADEPKDSHASPDEARNVMRRFFGDVVPKNAPVADDATGDDSPSGEGGT